MTRILLVDSYDVVRCGLKVLLRQAKNLAVCGEAADGIEAVRKSDELRPDIIIADFRLPGANGIILTRRVLKAHPEQKILIFACVESQPAIRDLLRAGIQGLVSRTEPAVEVLNAIEALGNNRTYFTSAIQMSIIAEYLSPHIPARETEPHDRLTPRQEEVTQLLVEGKVTKEIASILDITVKTAATHRAAVMRKLGAHNLAQMTLKAISEGIIEVPRLPSRFELIEGGVVQPRRESFARAAA